MMKTWFLWSIILVNGEYVDRHLAHVYMERSECLKEMRRKRQTATYIDSQSAREASEAAYGRTATRTYSCESFQAPGDYDTAIIRKERGKREVRS